MDFSKDYVSMETRVKGVWIDCGEDVSFKLRPIDMKDFQLRARQNILDAKIDFAKIDDDMSNIELRTASNKAIVDAFLLDWKGVEFKGEELKFSKEKAVELCNCSNAFRDLLYSKIEDISNFTSEKLEEVEKN